MKKDLTDIIEARNQSKSYLISCSPDVNQNNPEKLTQKTFFVSIFMKRNYYTCRCRFRLIFFVCKGLIRIYYKKEGKKITNYFIKENMVFAGSAHLSEKKILIIMKHLKIQSYSE